MAQTLFSTYRRRVLALLLLHPEQSFHVRELARRIEVPPGSLHRELKQLADAGLLLRQPVGNQVRYQANRDCPVFEELAGFFRKTAGVADVLCEALAPIADQIELAFVFGSVAEGKERISSDVDVMVIGDVTLSDVVKFLAPAFERLARQVNPVVMATAEFTRKHQKGDRFVKRISREPKIFLIGDEADLGKLSEDRVA